MKMKTFFKRVKEIYKKYPQFRCTVYISYDGNVYSLIFKEYVPGGAYCFNYGFIYHSLPEALKHIEHFAIAGRVDKDLRLY